MDEKNEGEIVVDSSDNQKNKDQKVIDGADKSL